MNTTWIIFEYWPLPSDEVEIHKFDFYSQARDFVESHTGKTVLSSIQRRRV